MSAECVLCQRQQSNTPVYGDDLWSLWPLTESVPGWMRLQTRRHVERVEDLTPTELASMGPTLARVSGALRDATGAEKVYLALYLEGASHVHFAVQARGADVALEHRIFNFFPNAEKYEVDPQRVQEVIVHVGRLLSAEPS